MTVFLTTPGNFDKDCRQFVLVLRRRESYLVGQIWKGRIIDCRRYVDVSPILSASDFDRFWVEPEECAAHMNAVTDICIYSLPSHFLSVYDWPYHVIFPRAAYSVHFHKISWSNPLPLQTLQRQNSYSPNSPENVHLPRYKFDEKNSNDGLSKSPILD